MVSCREPITSLYTAVLIFYFPRVTRHDPLKKKKVVDGEAIPVSPLRPFPISVPIFFFHLYRSPHSLLSRHFFSFLRRDLLCHFLFLFLFYFFIFILGCRKKRLLRCCWYREQHQQKEIDRPIVWSWHTIFYMDRELGLSRRTALQDIRVSFLEVFLSCPAPTVGARSRVALSVQRLQDPDALRTANPLRVRSGASK